MFCRTSLFITCSGLYAFLLITICLAFLTSEVVTDNSPLHYYEVSGTKFTLNAGAPLCPVPAPTRISLVLISLF